MLSYSCPRTDQRVYTSIDTSEEALRRLASFKLSVWCPYCDSSHAIMGKDAIVVHVPASAMSQSRRDVAG
jgi:hypothetical protein